MELEQVTRREERSRATGRSARGAMRKRWLHATVHVGALLPLVLLIAAYVLGRLSFNPIRDVILRTGRYAVVLLLFSLACTPAAALSGARALAALRKPLGLYAALYAGLHFAAYAAWDYGLQFDLIWLEIRETRFIQLGLATLLVLVPLAVTSTRRWRRRLGRYWKWLHRLAYAAGILAALHYWMAVKADRRLPLLYGIALVLLLVLRIPALQRAIRGLRSRLAGGEPA